MKKLFKLVLMGTLLFTVMIQPIMADQGLWGTQRNVVINGQTITGQGLMLLDILNGELIPPGRYWLNIKTGAWGYEGGPKQGLINENSSADNRSFDEVADDVCSKNPGLCS